MEEENFWVCHIAYMYDTCCISSTIGKLIVKGLEQWLNEMPLNGKIEKKATKPADGTATDPLAFVLGPKLSENWKKLYAW